MNKEELLKQYYKVKKQIRQLNEIKEDLKKLILKKGSFTTSEFICCVSVQERKNLRPLKDVLKVFSENE